MDDAVAQFTGITGSGAGTALQYLELSDGNLESAIQLFFDSGGIDLEGQDAPAASSSAAPPAPPAQNASREPFRALPGRVDSTGVVHIDSDEEISDDNDPQITGWGRRREAAADRAVPPRAPVATGAAGGMEEDEAFARRMQEELYADVGGPAGLDADGVRAPMARTTETLVGPGADLEQDMPVDMRAAIEAQMQARRMRAAGRPGIFNQRASGASVWEQEPAESGERRQLLAQATGGASEASSKASLLAEMYRPPHEIMSRLSWDEARQEGKEGERWILVNVQDPSVFDCQILNRDIWKDAQIKETVKENFIFLQYNCGDARGAQYTQFYFKDAANQDAYPHIAIVDPRTGEQVKVWSGPPVPKPMDYLMQLHEFLDRYSLKANAKNPVPTRKPERKKVDVGRMTEEEMLELALQNSLGAARQPVDDDPDALTRGELDGKGKGRAEREAVAAPAQATSGTTADAFSTISTTAPHAEPPASAPSTTRIQFRHSGGRVIRRFALADPVRRVYEWLRAEPLPGKEGVAFELVCTGRNLIELLEESVEGAGLRNQTVMVEFVED
ncbi:MAG: hypothetical protein M1832_004082 [Thelocarpon impressellum]|nr:MAG: hypothetical protein M1832_004082 [Thelocarpon impressellum]